MKERRVKLVSIKQNKRHSTIKQKERAWAHDQERHNATAFLHALQNKRDCTSDKRSEGHSPLHSRRVEGVTQQQQTTTKKTLKEMPFVCFDLSSEMEIVSSSSCLQIRLMLASSSLFEIANLNFEHKLTQCSSTVLLQFFN